MLFRSKAPSLHERGVSRTADRDHHVTDCWVARFAHTGTDYLFFVARNPHDHQQHTLIYVLSNGGSSIVGIPGEHSNDHMRFVDFPTARIGFHHSKRVEDFNFATGNFTRARNVH